MSNQPTSLPEEDIEFVMDTFQRSMGKSGDAANLLI